ncbi:MAG: aldehyde dehydrogenase family protein, partial [Armatimonadetes bacterium]|nr:aldehyde dehydrogenase family protein [Anaerolineae bacterium]
MPIPATPFPMIDDAIDQLNQHKATWLKLPIATKLNYLQGVIDRTAANAERWAHAACQAKGLSPQSPLAGEEWVSGPWALIKAMQSLSVTLKSYQAGTPRTPTAVRTRRDGQVIAQVFPQSIYDRLLLSGVHSEVWMEPGVTVANLPQHMGLVYRDPPAEGKVALVLGAGNISSIAPLDTLYKLYAEAQVIILKMNPVNEYLGAIFEDIFAQFVSDGFLRFAYGGAEVGEYIVMHAGLDEIHITGSARTHDAIVYGGGEEGQARKARNTPRHQKRITSELGAVCPVIVVPGPWDAADIQHQAANIATMKMHNAGFNCVAAQVALLPESWNQREALLDAVRAIFKASEARPAYYPGAAQRQQAAVSAHPNAERLNQRDVPTTLIANIDRDALEDICFRDEAFGGVLSTTNLPGNTAAEFLKNAVKFANEQLWGTLGANIIIHPQTMRE